MIGVGINLFKAGVLGGDAGVALGVGTPLQRILALSPSALYWPANGAGWQGTSGGTLAASGQPVGLVPDLSQLGGKTQAEWLAAPTTSEQRATGAPGIQGAATPATFDTATFAGAATRVDVSNQSFVVFSGFSPNVVVQVTVECLTGNVLVRSSTPTQPGGSGLNIAAGQTLTSYIQASASGTMGVASTANGTTSTFIVHSVRELPGNHLRAGTWASPSDAARATYVIQTDPALYDVTGQPELAPAVGALSGTDENDGGASSSFSGGVWTIATPSSLSGYPRVNVSVPGITVGKVYRVTGEIALTGISAVTMRLATAGVANTIGAGLTTVFDGVVSAAVANQINIFPAGTPSGTLTFVSLSVKEIPASQYKYALSFSGVDDYYSLLNAISITESMTVVRAFKRASTGIRSIGLANSTSSNPFESIWFTDNNSYLRLGGTQISAAGASTATGSYVDSSLRNPSAQYTRRNGAQILTGVAGTVTGSVSNIGWHQTGGPNYNSGEISFLAVFPTELTGADLALVEQIAALTNGAVLA